VDARPTYGYRRIAALIKRERRSAGDTPVNAKRVYRLMKKHGLLLARHTGRRRPRRHDGSVVTLRSNIRWCSDHFELACRNGELLRVLFAIDACDREVIAWSATTAGISGEMVGDTLPSSPGGAGSFVKSRIMASGLELSRPNHRAKRVRSALEATDTSALLAISKGAPVDPDV